MFYITNINMSQELLKNFAKRLKYLRKARKYTQDDLAAMSGISRSTIGMVESNKRDITLDKIEKIAKALGIEAKELFEF